MNLDQTKQKIIDFIKEQAGDKPVVIGLSGGLDSSVVAYLTAEALKSDKIHAILSPSSSNTQEDLDSAKQITKIFNLQSSIFNLDPIIESYQKNTDLFNTKESLGNLKARIRMSLLYGKANEIGGIVIGTGNKTEIMTGYFTKHGDGAADILPIGDLYKTEERELAKHIGVPQKIIDRKPTAGLWDNQYDEEELGITYERLDQILVIMENNNSLNKFSEEEVNLVKRLVNNSKHKRQLPPVCKIKD